MRQSASSYSVLPPDRHTLDYKSNGPAVDGGRLFSFLVSAVGKFRRLIPKIRYPAHWIQAFGAIGSDFAFPITAMFGVPPGGVPFIPIRPHSSPGDIPKCPHSEARFSDHRQQFQANDPNLLWFGWG